MTEVVTGVDLVEAQLQIAGGTTLAGLGLADPRAIGVRGFALQARVVAQVADTIRAKIGRVRAEDDAIFLEAYYRQLRARLERGMLFGKRRANKFAKD